MKIKIMSRNGIERLSQSPFTDKTALISITDVGQDFAKLTHKPDYLLQVAFDDVDNDIFLDEPDGNREEIKNKYHLITDAQAKQIADFYFDVKDKADLLICQCEHGQSRSAAVAAAFMEYAGRNGIKIFAHDSYYPNKAVFKAVYNQLKKENDNV